MYRSVNDPKRVSPYDLSHGSRNYLNREPEHIQFPPSFGRTTHPKREKKRKYYKRNKAPYIRRRKMRRVEFYSPHSDSVNVGYRPPYPVLVFSDPKIRAEVIKILFPKKNS